MRPPVFDLLEQDMERDAALPFIDLASRYFRAHARRHRSGLDRVLIGRDRSAVR